MRCRTSVVRAVAWAVMAAGVSGSAHAASEEDDLAAVFGDKSTVSIATGSRQPLRRAPAVATVITAEDIAAMGASDLDQVLESVPGMHVSRSNQVNSPLYVIRGIYSEFNPQTLMLQDGVPMTTLFVGNRGVLWGGLPVDNIARIEIIRGPGSALYGADAYSGVINIVTKSAQEVAGTELGVRLGSFATRSGHLQYGGAVGPVQVAGYLSLGRTDGFRATIDADAQTALDKLFHTTASLAPGSSSNQERTVDASLGLNWGAWRLHAGYKLRDDMGVGIGVANALDPAGRARSERYFVDLSRSDIDLAPSWKLALNGSYLNYSQRFPVPLQLFPPGAFGGAFSTGMLGAPETWERQLRIAAVSTYSGLDGHLLRIGVGHDDLDLYRSRELKNFTVLQSGPFIGLPVPTADGQLREFPVGESFVEPHLRKVDYLYLQDEWNFSRDWTLTAGVRHDRYSDAGGTTNPRLALVWDTSLDLTSKLLFGRAFRAPSFTEQYSINNPVIRGNPSLKPETIQTLEAAFAWQARADTQVNLNIFRYDMRDVIRTTLSSDGSSVFNNIGRQHGHGLELEGQWQASRQLRLLGHYAYQRSTDNATGHDAGYAPRQHAWARADWLVGSGWLASGQLNHVADRRRASGDLRPDIADYTTLDITLRSPRQRSGWEFSASVRNLFGADVREPSLAPGTSIPNDLPMAARALSFQAVYRP